MILIFFNSTPIVWHSKIQATIESSMFGYKVITLRNSLDNINIIWYKLRMMVVPINVPDYIFVDNMSVLNVASIPKCKIS